MIKWYSLYLYPGIEYTQIMQLTTEDSEKDINNKRRKAHFHYFSLCTLLCKKDLYYINDLAYENTENHLEIKEIKIFKIISVLSVVS